MRKYLQGFWLVTLAFLTLVGCGLLSDQPDAPDPNTTQGVSASASVSKDIGLECFGSGDIGCAQKNYCALQGEPGAGLRCCLAGFLQTYFSENTQNLGKMIGYSPLSFAEIKGMSRADLLAKKALPFAEIFLSSAEEATPIKELLKSWGASLSSQQVSSAELNAKLGELGQGLESSMTCLEGVMGQVKADTMEKMVFNSEKDMEINRRDLQFVRFALGASAYFLQFASQYQWGFEEFPALPLSDDFLKDINGKVSPSDVRWGELGEGGAAAIVAKFGLLGQTLSALQAFSDLKDQASHADDYLNWRLSEESQKHYSTILKAANDSLKSGEFVDLPEDDYQVRLGALGLADLIPDSRRVNDSLDVLKKDGAGEVTGNKAFFEAWGWNVVRPDPLPIAQP